MEGNTYVKEAGRLTVCAVIGLTAALFLIFIAALLISKGTIGEGASLPLAIGSLSCGCILSGFFAGRGASGRVLVHGLIAGVITFLLLLLIGALFFRSLAPAGGFWPMALACLVGGPIGSMLTALRRR